MTRKSFFRCLAAVFASPAIIVRALEPKTPWMVEETFDTRDEAVNRAHDLYARMTKDAKARSMDFDEVRLWVEQK